MLRVGIHIEPQYGFAFDDVVQIARTAEQAGYHALWSSDHLLWDAHSTRRKCFEAWTLLTALAPCTTTLRLGTLVSCNAFRHPRSLHARRHLDDRELVVGVLNASRHPR